MTIKTMLFGIGLAAAACTPALAQKGLDEPFQGAFKDALTRKGGGVKSRLVFATRKIQWPKPLTKMPASTWSSTARRWGDCLL